MAKRQSAVHRSPKRPAHASALELAALVRKELGPIVDPEQLRQFVCDRFHILSILCHEIHAAEQEP